MNECANSCCKEGYCKGTRHDCNNKYEKIEIIFIIVGSVFGIFLILFWIYYFIIGCNYNKIVERDSDEKKELKENQNYGNFVQHKNQNSQSDSQIDDKNNNLSNGTVQEENLNQFNSGNNEENKYENILRLYDKAPKRQIDLNQE